MGMLNDLFIRLKGDDSHLEKTLNNSEEKVGRFKGSVLKLGGIITGAVVAAFAIWKKAMESTEGSMDKLEAATSYFKGVFQGLMRTISTGDWGGLIDNITKTAKAYRDLTIAQDRMADVEASNVLKKSYLEKELQAARVAAAGAENPALKAQYLNEAIAAQKAITDINVNEVKARIQNYEQSYKTLAGFDDEASELMIKNIRKIAGNYESFFSENGQLAMLLIQKQSFAYKDQLGILTKVEKAQYNQVQAAVANLQIFQEFRDNLKPEEFNEYIKMLSTYNDEIAKGDQALIRMTGSLMGAENKLKDIKEIQRELAPGMADVSMFAFGSIPGLQAGPTMPSGGISADQQNWINSWKQATDEVTNMISDAFIGVFEAIGSGSFEGFGDALLKNFGNLVANLGKMLMSLGTTMLLAQTLMKTPSIPTAIAAIAAGAAAMAIGGLMMGAASRGASSMGSGGGGGGSYGGAQAGNLRIEVVGKISGKDIMISQRRYVEDGG